MLIYFFLLSFLSTANASINCEAKYDSLSITHQEVKNEEEFYFCFGYHHGKDRAWQMDYFKRTAQGRNAEVYGFAYLKPDLMMRLVALDKKAEEIWNGFPKDKKQVFEWYAQGVNEGFKLGKEAREFKDKSYEPEEWKGMDSITLLLLQSFDQTRKTFFKDYEEEKSKEVWGNKASEVFDEDDFPWDNTILKEGEYPKRDAALKKTTYLKKQFKLWSEFPTLFGEAYGSNNWVINGKKSKTGYAILANDPHLDLRTPLFWYWIHLKSPKTDVIGASLPGVPIIPSGTNGKVAWGLTNAYINTADLIFLKNEKEGDIISVRPTVKIKWGFLKVPFFFKSFEKTKSGHPVIPLEIDSKEKMILRWSGFSLTALDLSPMLDLIHVQNSKEMNEVLREVNLPAWNYVFADTKGDIGFRVVGKVYKYNEKNPYGIPHQTLKEIDNEEFLAPDERPHIFNPKRNYVYTANNRHWPLDSQFYGGRGYNFSFRGFRIDELLQGQHDMETFKKIQCDRQAVDARFFVPKLLPFLKNSELEGWNYFSHDDSVASSLYRRFMDLMMEKWKVNEYALFKLLDNLSSEQTRDLQVLYKLAKKEINNRPWAKLHRLGFTHLSKNNEWVFSPEIAGPGDNHSVDPGTAKWNEELGIYEQSSGASMRMIIEMRERPIIHLTLPGLNRNYSSRNSDSVWNGWKSCSYEAVSY